MSPSPRRKRQRAKGRWRVVRALMRLAYRHGGRSSNRRAGTLYNALFERGTP